MTRFRPIPMLTLLALSGCIGGTIEAPSLSQRDYEKQAVPVPDAASEPASSLDPVLAAKLKALLDQADAAHAVFTAAQARTNATITRAANTAAGSESWTAAQQELSALDTGRGPLQGIEADVDALRADPANATPANRTAIDAAGAQVQGLEDQETKAIAAMGTRLKS